MDSKLHAGANTEYYVYLLLSRDGKEVRITIPGFGEFPFFNFFTFPTSIICELSNDRIQLRTLGIVDFTFSSSTFERYFKLNMPRSF